MRIAFDVIGSKERAVAVMDLFSTDDPKKAAKDILSRYKHIRSVLGKTSARTGIYRIYRTRLIAGSRNTEVVHKEHGYLLKLDPRKVYFSPREATERERIAKRVKPKEKILVLFSGVAPFAIAISRRQPSVKIDCVELNRTAVDYANENVKLNKLENITNYCWDARDAAGLGKFDRIIMPLPERAWEFLDVAEKCSKKGATIHLYGISREERNFSDLERKVKERLKNYKIIGRQKVLPYAPRTWKVRLDIKL